MRKKQGLWKSFNSLDSANGHTPYMAWALCFVLATPIVILSCVVVVKHIFINNRPLDGPTVNLLLGLLGAATGGIVSSGFAMTKTISSMSSFTNLVSNQQPKVPRGPRPEGERD